MSNNFLIYKKEEIEYVKEIPQSHTADQPTVSWGRAEEQ